MRFTHDRRLLGDAMSMARTARLRNFRRADLLVGLAARLLPRGVMRDKRHFATWEGRGYHVTPVHFYEPVPDTRRLDEALWHGKRDLAGWDWNTEQQLEFLERFDREFRSEYELFAHDRQDVPAAFHLENVSFQAVDAEVLYSMLRHLKPKRIVEVGSGFTTLLIAAALDRNHTEGHSCHYTVVDPYPSDMVRELAAVDELMETDVQRLPVSFFSKLDEDDILFIDSTHVLAIGSDVQFEFMEVVPRLNAGVVVHFHDIFLPLEYPRDWIFDYRRFWNEQYLVYAFFAYNREFEILLAASYLSVEHADAVKAAVPSFRAGVTRPSSLWLRRRTPPPVWHR